MCIFIKRIRHKKTAEYQPDQCQLWWIPEFIVDLLWDNGKIPHQYITNYVHQFYVYRQIPGGFCTHQDDNTMKIIFKAIIPTHVWGWDEKSAVYMRFEHEELGKWEYDYGPGVVERLNNTNSIEFQTYCLLTGI